MGSHNNHNGAVAPATATTATGVARIDNAAAPPPPKRSRRRTHGLQLPLHTQQVAAWMVLVTYAFLTVTVTISCLASWIPRVTVLVLCATVYLSHAMVHLTATLLDPADPNLRAKSSLTEVPVFDRSRHAHVIENGHCHLCDISISGQRTKHCSACNKCVHVFDHHCKWLNTCIGR